MNRGGQHALKSRDVSARSCSGTIRKSEAIMVQRRLRFFQGGADLEMLTIRKLIVAHAGEASVEDKGLRWGARASEYLPEIEASIGRGETAVLVELKDDLPANIDRSGMVFVDHHGERAGAARPSALRQVFELLGLPERRWTRELSLVEANDIGHIRGLREMGASEAEIVAVRTADRRAQGILEDVDLASRAALHRMQKLPGLDLIRTKLPTSSAITDFLEPEFGGPGYENLLVVMPAKLAFYGDGRVIADLAGTPGCWFGGALPDRGYWGMECRGKVKDAIVRTIKDLAAAGVRARS